MEWKKFGTVFSRVFYMITALLALLLFLLVFHKDIKNSELNQSSLRQIQFIGTYQEKAGDTPRRLDADSIAELGKYDTLMLKGHFSEDIERKEQLLLFIHRFSVRIYQNGRLIYDYGGPGTHSEITRGGGSVWGNFYSEGIKTSDKITIIMNNYYKRNSYTRYEQFLNSIHVGEKMELFLKMLQDNVFKVSASIMIFILGVVLLMATLTLMVMRADLTKSIFYCGVLFLVSGLWLLLDYAYASLLIPMGATLDVVETLTLLSMLPLAIHYVRNFMVSRARYILAGMEYLFLTVSMFYIVLQWRGIIDGEMMQEIYMALLPYVVMVSFLCLLIEIINNEDAKNRWVVGSGLILIIFGVAGFIYEAVNRSDGESIFCVGLCMFALIQFFIAMHYTKESLTKAKQTSQMEKELMDNRISVMMSQIQPHFLYNSISCIQELCLSEPKKAHDALAQFAHFLRGNMDSLNSNQPIPFEQELCHVKNYLALEKIRFEERLNIVYDIEAEGFLVPALTVQPIVENAVRYGISKKKSGGTLKITTREEWNDILITVSDDGIGFDPLLQKASHGKGDKRSHIGMENVQKRLKSQCGGSMEVSSHLEEGTIVKIRIPK